MFQKCRNSIILPAALPLNVTGDAQIMCPDPICPALTLQPWPYMKLVFFGCSMKHPRDVLFFKDLIMISQKRFTHKKLEECIDNICRAYWDNPLRNTRGTILINFCNFCKGL